MHDVLGLSLRRRRKFLIILIILIIWIVGS